MNLQEKFLHHWKINFRHLSSVNCHLLLAVSGGVDSVVLTDLISKAGFDFTILHCNFQLRGDESKRDELFVRSLGEKYNKKVLVKTFDTNLYATENKISIQVAARELRYAWFQEVNRQSSTVNRQLITTAHHADDNIETVLINFFRGTGIQGLKGIQPFIKEQNLIRPLLNFRKEELLNYAKENNLSFVEDSSNSSDKYARNYFRNQLIPSVKEIFSNAEENILNNIERFNEAEMLYDQAIQAHRAKLMEQNGNEFHIPVLKLKKAQPLHAIVWEIIKDFNFSSAQTNEAIKLLDADNGSSIQSSTHRIIKNRKWIIIAPLQTNEAKHILIERGEKKVIFANGELHFEIISDTLTAHGSQLTASLDFEKINFPFMLRPYKQGDYFYPLGMQKKKKLNRFFIDQKLSATDKEKVWVIESNKKIVWVIGLRIDDRFKITASTKNILKVGLSLNKG
ncbi:tRNA(Ile)-lysidine synthase [mine drainage metagenome]|uniref:tRNA(Ile)-lysidine synthetase n=1 Tax=mine drainage metagenome TaxID=410659 RepID=A0A1J5SFY2_9ZZZZ